MRKLFPHTQVNYTIYGCNLNWECRRQSSQLVKEFVAIPFSRFARSSLGEGRLTAVAPQE